MVRSRSEKRPVSRKSETHDFACFKWRLRREASVRLECIFRYGETKNDRTDSALAAHFHVFPSINTDKTDTLK